jgi:hypothetical protein
LKGSRRDVERYVPQVRDASGGGQNRARCWSEQCVVAPEFGQREFSAHLVDEL